MKKIITIIAAITSSVLSAQQLHSIVACYPLACDNAVNYSVLGPSLNGIINNVFCSTGPNNQPNGSYKFMGTAHSFIELPNDPNLKAPAVCVSGWFKMHNTTSNQYLFFIQNNYNCNFEGLSLTYSAGGFQLRKNSGGCTNFAMNSVIGTPLNFVAGNQWHHIVFYTDAQKMWLMVDNNILSSANHAAPINYLSTASVILGGTNAWYNLPFTGLMSDVRFYSQELSTSDINAIFHGTQNCSIGPKPTGIDALSSTPVSLKLFPNPSHGKFILESESELNFTVTDISGKMVAHTISKIEAHQSEISLNEAKAGLYFVNIYDQKGELIRTEKMAVME